MTSAERQARVEREEFDENMEKIRELRKELESEGKE